MEYQFHPSEQAPMRHGTRRLDKHVFQSKRRCSTEQVKPRERSKRNALPLSPYHVQRCQAMHQLSKVIQVFSDVRLPRKTSEIGCKTRIDTSTVLMWCLANQDNEIKRPSALYSLEVFLDARSLRTLIR